MRDWPGVMWLLLAVAVALAHRAVPESTWLMVHLVLLGALTHSAMVWSTHFASALLKVRADADDRTRQSRRLVTLLVGTSLVLVGVPSGWWPVTVTGAALVSIAVLWHGIRLWRMLRAALPARFRVTVRYYVAAAGCVPVGATLGAILARGPADAWHGRLIVAHSMVMVLGWLGLTLTGTLLTLWPTMLRTRIDDRAERWARQALPALLVALAVVVAGALAGTTLVAAGGLGCYLLALGWWGRALVRPALTRPPREYATYAVTAALGWLVVGIASVLTVLLADGAWPEVARSYTSVGAILAAGFAAQLVTGALSYLIPSVLGGGPSVVRAGQAWFERLAGTRVTLVNGGLVVCLLPVPSAVRVACSVLVLVGLALFVPLMLGGIRAGVAARRKAATDAVPVAAHAADGGVRVQVVSGLAILAMAVSLGVAVDPASAGLQGAEASSAVAAAGRTVPTGHTTRVRITARNMRYDPARIEVPVGDRLVLELVNADPDTSHDLTFGAHLHTGRLRPGQHAELDVGVVSRSLTGWCSVVGHRMRGMTLQVHAVGASTVAGSGGAGASSEDGPASPTGSAMPDMTAGSTEPDTSSGPSAALAASALDPDRAAAAPVDPVLPPLSAARTHRVTLRATTTTLEVAPGVWQRRWTYNGKVPGPTLHGRVGDTFVVTLVNDADMGHSIDFHAGERSPDAVMRTIPPGGRLTYRFTAHRAGLWLYHCSTMPMSAHLAAGMFGAVVIEPPKLPKVDRSYLLVQSEAYLDTRSGTTRERAGEVDAEKVSAERPDAVTFNGQAFQYDHTPLTARVGQRVRLWVLDAGPSRETSFHVVGGQLDTVYLEGSYLLRNGRDAFGSSSGGSQALALAPGQGGFVELRLTEPGSYPVVSHVMVDAERGAHGILRATR